MKKVLLGVGCVLAVSILGVLAAASMQSDTYHVERSVTLAAAPADVFPYANDYAKWPAWNPWAAKDPGMKTETSNPSAGVGAWTTWSGNEEVGSGREAIVESVPNERVVQKLEFHEPFEDTTTVTFSMAAAGEGTTFTWAMDGNKPFVSKVMCLFFSMDGMIGGDFESGLTTLKAKAEADAVVRKEAERVAAEAAAVIQIPVEDAAAN